MRSGFIARMAAALVLAALLATTAGFSEPQAKVTLNEKVLKEKAVVVSGKCYLPLQTMSNILQKTLVWDPGSNALKVADSRVQVKTLYRNGTVYVPVAATAKAAGVEVRWDPDSYTVHIYTEKIMAVPTTKPTPIVARPSPIPEVTPAVVLEQGTPFIPVTASDGIFSVTITNVEVVDSIKNYYKPKAGNKFAIVYLSQQNISDEVQIYTGKFSFVDSSRSAYDYLEGLSNFWLIVLRPGGINFGYLVFEIPAPNKAMQVVLHSQTRPPLTAELK